MNSSPQKEVHCSFCRRPASQVKRILAQRGVYVCNDCISQFKNLLRQNHEHHSTCGCSENSPH